MSNIINSIILRGIVTCFTLFLSGFIIAQNHSQAFDEELSFYKLEEEMMVYVASKKKETIAEAPAVITVVTAEEIRQFGGRNLADIFQRLPSMFMFGSTFMDNMSISTRGGKLTHTNNWILFLLNGRPIRESHNGGLHSDIFTMFPVETIDHIEIIRGPGSVIYGTNAFSGVVNIVTKSAKNQPRTVAASYGSFNTKTLTLTTGIDANELDITMSAKYLDSDGWQMSATDERGTFDTQKRPMSGTQLALRGTYKDFTLETLIGRMEQFTAGFFVWGLASGDKYPLATEQRRYVDLSYHPEITDDWKLVLNYTFNGHSMQDKNAKRVSEGSLIELTSIHQVSEDMGVLWGATVDMLNGNLSTLGSGGRYDTTRYSGYVQTDYRVHERIKLVAGIQGNKSENLPTEFSPRLSIITTLNERWGLKLLYGEAYRNAYAFQSFFNIPSFKGNPSLEPEKIATYDAQIFYKNLHTYGALTYFYSTIQDSHFRPHINGITTVANSPDEIVSDGLELELKTDITDWISVQGSALYQKNKNDMGTNDVLFNPNFMAKAGISFTSSNKKYIFSVFNSYFGDAGKLENVNSNIKVVNPSADAYNLLTMQLEWKPVNNIALSIFADNILDADIHFPDLNRGVVNTVPQHSGRAAYATITVSF